MLAGHSSAPSSTPRQHGPGVGSWRSRRSTPARIAAAVGSVGAGMFDLAIERAQALRQRGERGVAKLAAGVQVEHEPRDLIQQRRALALGEIPLALARRGAAQLVRLPRRPLDSVVGHTASVFEDVLHGALLLCLDAAREVANAANGACRAEIHRDDVYAVRMIFLRRRHQIRLRRGDQAAALGGRNGLFGGAVPQAAARLDLDEDQLALMLGDEVQLAVRAAPVARDDAVASRLEPARGDALTARAQAPARAGVAAWRLWHWHVPSTPQHTA